MTATNKNSDNIRKYRKPLNINIGLIIFSIIFIYIIICVFLYFTSNHIIGYEVNIGTLSVENVYNGIAIRDEEIINSDYSGYINYYAREGEKVGVSNLVYSVDESGKLSETLNTDTATGENTLTDENISELKTDILSFTNTYSNRDFAKVYDFKYDIQGTVLKLSNTNTLNSLGSLSGNSLNGMINFGRAPKDGVVSYNIDGYESLKESDITAAVFDKDSYKKEQQLNNDLVSKGDPVYKISRSENWSIVIPVDEERAQELTDDPYVKIKFLKNQRESWATATILKSTDGSLFANLALNNSMITFCTDRYIDIELEFTEEAGLKIPLSSIVEKEFFLIPLAYITKGGDGTTDGFMRESYAEDGSVSTEFVPTTIYNSTETDYYVDDSSLKIGDYIIKPDSNDKYPISKKATLIGVYNINKGYADFKQIIILYQNTEYAIVQSNTQYGLSVYDYIVLDASTVSENDFVH
ncbi:MAG: HlyD family efflux transporter periplasmic adaptor subunit [Lachnospiraceae bacterium]|nr:HlyD family efflux transporter periplasmic adaptor subunit [Lachnospiraceae bacterium]